jgi:hypothetical protein
MSELKSQIIAIDHQLSKTSDRSQSRRIFYYLSETEKPGLICAKHYSNIINEKGLAVNPETGKVIGARQKLDRNPESIYTARTAKELAVKVIEETQPCPITMFDHACLFRSRIHPR